MLAMAVNPLSASSLSSFIAASLPKDASPQLKSPLDAIAIACHAGMLAVGFRLIGLGEDHRIEAHSDPSEAQPLPQEWNANSSHAFRYAHSQSSMEYLLKATRLGAKIVVNGIGIGDDKTAAFDLTTTHFISAAALPATPCPASSTSQEDTHHAISSIFITPSRLSDLGALLRLSIIQKLVPGLQKPGYEESSPSTTTTNNTAQPRETDDPSRHPYPTYDPLRDDRVLTPPAQPHNPLADPSFHPRQPPARPAVDFPPPSFEDEHQILRPARGPHPAAPLPGYGDADLYPAGLGPRDPLRISGAGPLGLRSPPPTGGMHPSFDDPLFGARDDGRAHGYDLQAPPGARWDPLGPGGGPGWPGGRQGRPPHNPFGGFGGGDFI